MTVGENIKRIRKEKGLTQKALGQLCNMNESQIRRYELGLSNSNPKIETIQKIATGLGVPWEILLSDQQEVDLIIKEEMKKMVDSMNFEAVTPKNGNIWDLSIEVLENRHKYIQLYDELNKTGQDKAIEQVELLTKIPEYRKDETET